MILTGSKLKLVNAMDNAMSDSLSTSYTIELVLTKSPKKGVKCGAIALFKMNEIKDLDWKDDVDPMERFQAEKEMNEMSESMLRDPELFKETDNKWLSWALDRVIQLFDEFGTDADIIVKSPKLKIRHKISRSEVIANRSDTRKLFKIAFEIDKLLSGKFSYDPWGKVIRRGEVGVEFSKR